VENPFQGRALEPSNAHHAKVEFGWGWLCRTRWTGRKKAMECGELAKYARPAFLGDFYRRVAMRYVFMAEEILNVARARGEIANETDRRAAPSRTIATSSERSGGLHAVRGISATGRP
jgi:hypothetical protein